MSTLTALQIISHFEPSIAQGFYTDISTSNVIQLNFGFGLDFTANGDVAVNILQAALLDSGVSQPDVYSIISNLIDYQNNSGLVNSDTSPIVVQLNAILVSANVPVKAVAEEAASSGFGGRGFPGKPAAGVSGT